jgi:hypothetical protein
VLPRQSAELRRALATSAREARVISVEVVDDVLRTPPGEDAVKVRSSKPGKPCSFTVGTSGNAGERSRWNGEGRAASLHVPHRRRQRVLDLRVPATAHRLRRLVGRGCRRLAILMRSIERCVVVPMPRKRRRLQREPTSSCRLFAAPQVDRDDVRRARPEDHRRNP